MSRFFDNLVAETAQCRMDRFDQASDLVGRDVVLSHVCRHDLARAALVIGDPPLEGSTVFKQLPGAAAEARVVAAALRENGFETIELVERDALWPTVLSSLYGHPYRILHIAAHGVHEYEQVKGEKKVTGVVLGNGAVDALKSNLPPEWTGLHLDGVMLALPYLLTLAMLAGVVGRATAPAADGVPYDPEARS